MTAFTVECTCGLRPQKRLTQPVPQAPKPTCKHQPPRDKQRDSHNQPILHRPQPAFTPYAYKKPPARGGGPVRMGVPVRICVASRARPGGGRRVSGQRCCWPVYPGPERCLPGNAKAGGRWM